MPVGEDTVLAAVIRFIERQGLDHKIEDEQHCTKIDVRKGMHTATVSVYNSGKIVTGGPPKSPLRDLLEQMKQSMEQNAALPGHTLPFEIDNFPVTIQERVVDCDPVIIRFIGEAIQCYKSESILACAFMLGAASEKAINIMIDAYTAAIRDETNREKFNSRVNGRTISKKFDEFFRSFSSCKSRPTEPQLAQDLDERIIATYQFCRITRNEIGHPQIVPELDKGVILANLGQFVTYIERIYALKIHFETEGVIL